MAPGHRKTLFRLFSLFSLALLLLPALAARYGGGVSPVRRAALTLLAPLQDLVRRAGEPAAEALRAAAAGVRLRRENEDLRERLSQYDARLLEAEAVFRENAALREQLGMEARCRDCTLCAARILSAADGFGGRVYTLDRGTADGAEVGCAVLTPSGMAGRIRAAGPDWSEMIPVTHRDFRAAARLFFSGEAGIAAGDGETLTLTALPEDSRALPGDRVLTGGAGSAYPPGQLLGALETVTLREDGLAGTARVRTFVPERGARVYIVTDFVSLG